MKAVHISMSKEDSPIRTHPQPQPPSVKRGWEGWVRDWEGWVLTSAHAICLDSHPFLSKEAILSQGGREGVLFRYRWYRRLQIHISFMLHMKICMCAYT